MRTTGISSNISTRLPATDSNVRFELTFSRMPRRSFSRMLRLQ